VSNHQGLTGLALLKNARYNKSTAFTEEERDKYKLRGLLPACVSTQAQQIERILGNLRRQCHDIDRYIALMALQNRNESLFYRLLIDHIEEFLPIIYTPTVGDACQQFAHIFTQTRGFYITPNDKDCISEILQNWPEPDVRVIVITDGERILGLGDLGANGMGIPIGKLSLYTACAGIFPQQCLPVMLDVGTNNKTLRNDPLYLGLKQDRITGDAYTELLDEFVNAIQQRYPKALIQFEDFLTPNAIALLQRYRDKVLCFNDDIQGTAAVILAGVLASCRLSHLPFTELSIVFVGAGSATTGIADLIQAAWVKEGLSPEQARAKLWFVDSQGLVVKSRNNLAAHKLAYAHEHEPADLLQAVASIKPHILIGATGSANAFTEAVIRLMSELNARPAIFALSNPTSRAECTAEQAYQWSDGRAIFSSGSPFAPVEFHGKLLYPGQGNNAYIFPGMGLGIVASTASYMSDEMFIAAAEVLASSASEQDLQKGTLYPPLSTIRQVSLRIAVAVAHIAYKQQLTEQDCPDDLEAFIAAQMYQPTY